MNKLNIYFEGIKVVFKHNAYLFSFLFFAMALFWFFIYIPVRNIPGNDFAFQLTFLKPQDFLLLAILALLTSLSINMNIYSFRQKATIGAGVSAVSQGGVGGRSWNNCFNRSCFVFFIFHLKKSTKCMRRVQSYKVKKSQT